MPQPPGLTMAALGWPGLPPPGQVASGYAKNASMALGSEQATGTLTRGEVVQDHRHSDRPFLHGCAVNDTFVASAATALDANNKVQEFLQFGSAAYLNLGEPSPR